MAEVGFLVHLHRKLNKRLLLIMMRFAQAVIPSCVRPCFVHKLSGGDAFSRFSETRTA